MIGKNFTSAGRDDNVYTPYSITEQLLENEKFDYDKAVLEPAMGNGAMFKILDRKFNHADGYDIIDNIDFFKQKEKFNYIITNPPYSKLDKFIVKAKEIATEKFAFLCKLTHLGGVQRFTTGIFRDENYPLTKIYLFTRQANLRFTNDEQEMKGYPRYREIREDGKYPAGMYYYAWLIWENYENKSGFLSYQIPTFHWIDNNKYILSKKDMT